MSKQVDHSELELEQDLKWTERSWIIQRIGWALLLLFVSSAALGLFGNGILSKVHEQSNEYSLEYDRYGRYEMPQQIKISAPSINDKVVLTVPQSFTENYDIQLLTPQPRIQLFDSSNIVMEFEAKGPVILMFEVEAQQSGRHQAEIFVNNKAFTISQFIYP